MKILLTGGGSGGHFYPIIAIAGELNEITKENHLLRPDLYYMADSPYNEGLLFENNIRFRRSSSGKIRLNMSPANVLANFVDFFKIVFGAIAGLFTVYNIYPDVIFGKGGYASFPALFAAKLLRIPVVIHESDTVPGKVNKWAGKFAQKIAVSYPETAQYFPAGKTAYTGNPIRKELMEPLTMGAREFLKLEEGIPTLFILGGSGGAQALNELLMDVLPDLVSRYQIIHQTGKKNIKVMKDTAEVILAANPHKDRYKPFDYLNILSMRMSAGACDLVISRAGSTIFEIASWGKPSIIIPIPERVSHDQRSNAYAYARSGACEVIEQDNLTPHVFIAEIDRILNDKEGLEKMKTAATTFARRDSARLIAQEIMAIALSHEK